MEPSKSPIEEIKGKYVKLFTDIGLKPGVVKSTIKSKKITAKLVKLLKDVGVENCESKFGVLYYDIATCCPQTIQ